MQRVWATVAAVWAMLAIVAVLAWTHGRPAGAAAQATPTTVIVRLKGGTQQVVAVQPAAGAPHATTTTSPVPAP
jgi:hypothetical protein